jgi:hypothetical protein
VRVEVLVRVVDRVVELLVGARQVLVAEAFRRDQCLVLRLGEIALASSAQ